MTGPQPDLNSDRIILTALRERDQVAIFQLHSDPEVQRYLSRKEPSNQQESLAFIRKIQDGVNRRAWCYWGLRLQEDPEHLIGTICLWQFNTEQTEAELGYDLLPTFQKRGLMQEAVETILRFAKDQLHLEKVAATVNTANQSSIRLLVRNNFNWIRKLDEDEKFSGEQGQEIDLYECLW